MLLFIAIEIQLTYISKGKYSVEIDGATYAVEGTLDDLQGSYSEITSFINGKKTKARVVQNQDSIHVFTAVSHLSSFDIHAIPQTLNRFICSQRCIHA